MTAYDGRRQSIERDERMIRRQLLERATLGIGAMALTSLSDSESSAAPTGALETILEPIRTRHDLPALVGAFLLDGKLAAKSATGVRKYGSDVKATVNDQFHIG